MILLLTYFTLFISYYVLISYSTVAIMLELDPTAGELFQQSPPGSWFSAHQHLPTSKYPVIDNDCSIINYVS